MFVAFAYILLSKAVLCLSNLKKKYRLMLMVLLRCVKGCHTKVKVMTVLLLLYSCIGDKH